MQIMKASFTVILIPFFSGKTVIVVAHRLSTVKNADQIVVLNKEKLLKLERHKQLVALRGQYYTLVRNQLELRSIKK